MREGRGVYGFCDYINLYKFKLWVLLGRKILGVGRVEVSSEGWGLEGEVIRLFFCFFWVV